MTEIQKPEKTDAQNAKPQDTGKNDCGINAIYGLVIALSGLLVSFVIAIIMIWFGMRTASDLVAVIGVFTGITGTLTGYFFGEKAGSAGRENTENKLSASTEALSSERTKSAVITGKLEMIKSDNKRLSSRVVSDQTVINESYDELKKAQTEMRERGQTDTPIENIVNKVLDSLNKAKIPEDILDSLIIKDD